MPVTDEDRAAYARLDGEERDKAIYDQLRRIRENATGPAMNHEAVNDALDKIETLWSMDDEREEPAPHPEPVYPRFVPSESIAPKESEPPAA